MNGLIVRRWAAGGPEEASKFISLVSISNNPLDIPFGGVISGANIFDITLSETAELAVRV